VAFFSPYFSDHRKVPVRGLRCTGLLFLFFSMASLAPCDGRELFPFPVESSLQMSAQILRFWMLDPNHKTMATLLPPFCRFPCFLLSTRRKSPKMKHSSPFSSTFPGISTSGQIIFEACFTPPPPLNDGGSKCFGGLPPLFRWPLLSFTFRKTVLVQCLSLLIV